MASGSATAGTVRRYATIAAMSSSCSLDRLLLTASAMPPPACALPATRPVFRYWASSTSLQPPIPLVGWEVMLGAYQSPSDPPAKALPLTSCIISPRGLWQLEQCARPSTR
ncbi:hypothetical protein D3C81_1612440 [compost metagenome]